MNRNFDHGSGFMGPLRAHRRQLSRSKCLSRFYLRSAAGLIELFRISELLEIPPSKVENLLQQGLDMVISQNPESVVPENFDVASPAITQELQGHFRPQQKLIPANQPSRPIFSLKISQSPLLSGSFSGIQVRRG
jgi:hypothetical protein